MRVWGIWYTIRCSSSDKWVSWVGPIGVYSIDLGFSPGAKGCLGGRPLFFRTRKLARDCAKNKAKARNLTWTWVKYQVRPLRLDWEEIQRGNKK